MSRIKSKEIEKEILIPLEGEEYFIARIIISSIGEKYHSEIDIINKESRKIYIHVNNVYNQDSYEEILSQSVQILSEYFNTLG